MIPRTAPRIAPTVGPLPVRQRVLSVDATEPRPTIRVRVPGVVEVGPGSGQRFRLHDLGVTGFGFQASGRGFGPGEVLRASLDIVVDAIALTLFAKVQVLSRDGASGRVDCRFVDLGAQETIALRHIVSCRLNGRPVQVAALLQATGHPAPAPARDR